MSSQAKGSEAKRGRAVPVNSGGRFGAVVRRVLPALLLVLVTVSAAALDAGGRLRVQGDFEQDEDPRGRMTLNAWTRLFPQLQGEATAELLIEGTAIFQFDDFAAADLEYLTARVALPGVLGEDSVFRLRGGRYQLRDRVGLIVDHRVDGLGLGVDYPRVGVRLAGGYTGLLLKQNSSIVMSLGDVTDQFDEFTTTAPPRWIGQLEVDFPELFARQTLVLGGIVQHDRRSGEEDTVDTQYGYLGLSGRIAGGLYYQSGGVFGAVQRKDASPAVDDVSGSMVAASHRFVLFAESLSRSVFTVRGLYASGGNGDFEDYTPITSVSTIALAPVPTADLLLGSAEYTFRPFFRSQSEIARNIGLTAYGVALFDSDPTADDAYHGTEAGGRIALRPFSDIGGSIRVGAFIPEEGDVTVRGRVEFSTSF